MSSDFYEQYDELATMVLEDPRPNGHLGIPYNNVQLTQIICNLLDVEYFDIFDNIDNEDVYYSEDKNRILGICYIHLLRFLLFGAASENNIGDDKYNEIASAYANYWYLKLLDRWFALEEGVETKHVWLM